MNTNTKSCTDNTQELNPSGAQRQFDFSLCANPTSGGTAVILFDELSMAHEPYFVLFNLLTKVKAVKQEAQRRFG